MSQLSDEEFTMDDKRNLWQIGVGRRKSTPKRHYVDDAQVIPESIKRLCYEEGEEEQVECQGCEQKQSEVSQLKREVAQLLRLTEYQQADIDMLKKELTQSRRRNDELQRSVIAKMDNLAVIVTNSTPARSLTPPRESPRPSSPSSQHLVIPSASSPAASSSHYERVDTASIDQDDHATRLGIHPDLLGRFIETKDSKTISQFTKDVAVSMFGRETLASHSLKGQMSTAHHKNMLDVKPALPAERVEALMDFVLSVFPSTDRKVVKNSLREKLNDESKLMKKRLQKEMGSKQLSITKHRKGRTM